MSNLGSTKIFVDKAQWNSRTSRQKGRSSEALAVNASLDAISTSLHSLYHKYQDDQTISLDKLRSAYLGQIQEFSTFLPVFDKFIDDIRQRVGHTISKESLQKYCVLRRHFFEFLVHRYKRKDIGLMEFTPAIIQDFELYLTTVALCAYNTAVKKMKTLKTVTIYALKRGYLLQDPFRDHHFHLAPVDRGFLTDEEIMEICNIASEVKPTFIKTSSGTVAGGATAEDVALMRKTVAPAVKVKASGGIRTADDFATMVAAGAERIGCSQGIPIIEEFRRRMAEAGADYIEI